MTPPIKNPAAVALGSIKSVKKATASRKNGIDQRPHVLKINHFLSVYPYSLKNNEYLTKFPVGTTPKGKTATYNPDYFCSTTNMFIEVCTSKPNISEQGWKWAKAIETGVNLKIFWWEGEEITEMFTPQNFISADILAKKTA